MTPRIEIDPLIAEPAQDTDEAGLGALRTDRGNLPLTRVDVHATVSGLSVRSTMEQTYSNPHDEALEATYVFPLPSRAAVTGLSLHIGTRVVEADLAERAQARRRYDEAVADGRRAAIAEEERPEVFTLRVGNIQPGEQVEVRLETVAPLPFADGAANYRLPLVVAPRYIPGTPLGGPDVGDGTAPDTNAVPDASRISPPVLLPGFAAPVELRITMDVDAAGLPLSDVCASMPVHIETCPSGLRLRVEPNQRLDRDFVVRFHYGAHPGPVTALALIPDADGTTGTFELTVLAPQVARAAGRDVVVLVDRSGSMNGWKMVAARRAAARIVDSLGSDDRFAVLGFDDEIAAPPDLPATLTAATDRNRFRAVSFLASLEARGGTELLRAIEDALAMFDSPDRDRCVVMLTDGQVGDEDRVVAALGHRLRDVRLHAIGIDSAVNAGLFERLATLSGGCAELVESEDRLDEAAAAIHRRIAAPGLTELALAPSGLELEADTVTPVRLPDVFPGVPVVIRGRYLHAEDAARILVSARDASGELWQAQAATRTTSAPAASLWARGHLRDLEDALLADRRFGPLLDADAVQQRIVEISLQHRVLCRFTAWVAVDDEMAEMDGPLHRIVQPVELPTGWALPTGPMDFAVCAPAGPASGALAGAWESLSMTDAAEHAQPLLADLPALLRATGSDTTEDLQDWLQRYTEWDVTVELDGDEIVVLLIRGVAIGLGFPFAMAELLDLLDELDAGATVASALEELAEEIEAVEGFSVTISCSLEQDIDFQQPETYPYQRAATGSTTVAAWRDGRFWKNYPDFDIVVLRPDRADVAGQTRLRTLRGLWRDAWAALPRPEQELLAWHALIPKLQPYLDLLRTQGWSVGPFGDASDQDGPDDGPEYPPCEHHAVDTLVRRDDHVALVEFRRYDFDGEESLILWAYVDPDDPLYQGLIDVVDDPGHTDPERASSYDEAVGLFRRLGMIH